MLLPTEEPSWTRIFPKPDSLLVITVILLAFAALFVVAVASQETGPSVKTERDAMDTPAPTAAPVYRPSIRPNAQ
jgi:hypothetical protein